MWLSPFWTYPIGEDPWFCPLEMQGTSSQWHPAGATAMNPGQAEARSSASLLSFLNFPQTISFPAVNSLLLAPISQDSIHYFSITNPVMLKTTFSYTECFQE